MGWENLLGYMFLFLFTQPETAKGEVFTAPLQKNKSNPAIFRFFRLIHFGKLFLLINAFCQSADSLGNTDHTE